MIYGIFEYYMRMFIVPTYNSRDFKNSVLHLGNGCKCSPLSSWWHCVNCISAGNYVRINCSVCTNIFPCTIFSDYSTTWLFPGYISKSTCLGFGRLLSRTAGVEQSRINFCIKLKSSGIIFPFVAFRTFIIQSHVLYGLPSLSVATAQNIDSSRYFSLIAL